MTTAVERCERSDLFPDECGHCRTPEAFKRQPEPQKATRGTQLLGRWFEASWPGRCSRCRRPFRAGDEIRADYPRSRGFISWQCHRTARAGKRQAEAA